MSLRSKILAILSVVVVLYAAIDNGTLRLVAARFFASWEEQESVADLGGLYLFDRDIGAARIERAASFLSERDIALDPTISLDILRNLPFGTPLETVEPDVGRIAYELWEGIEDPALADEAWRLAYPLAHDRMVWATAQDNDVDPYLVLGLMRQESTYNAIAVSRVGARGAMQIMPRTGYLLADRLDDRQFHGGQLEDHKEYV